MTEEIYKVIGTIFWVSAIIFMIFYFGTKLPKYIVFQNYFLAFLNVRNNNLPNSKVLLL